MRIIMKATLLAAILFATVSAVEAQVSIGIVIGQPPPPRVIHIVSARPAPEFIWVEGYWYPVKKKYKWHDGYWTRPPYAGAIWVPAHYDGRQFFVGYWQGNLGRVEHDHRWDRDHDRDHDRKGGRKRGRK